MNIATIQKYVETHLVELLSSMFKEVSYLGRFTVEKGLELVKGGRREERFNIYFDDEFISSFTDRDHPITVDRQFLIGFLDQYEKGNIYINEGTYEEAEKNRRYEKMMKDAAEDAERKKDLSSLSADEKQLANKILDDVKG